MSRDVEVALAEGLRERASHPAAASSPAAGAANGQAPAGSPEAALPLLHRAALAVLEAEAVEDANISVALLDDDGIAELNRRYLDHEGPTDVLSFPLYGPGEEPAGDVYIGYEQALRQAKDLGVPVSEELARLAVHGTLHVLGYTHPEGEEREGSELWRRQEAVLTTVLGERSREGR